MLIWLIFGLCVFGGVGGVYLVSGGSLLLFVLLALLGWSVFGPPIRG